MVDNLIVNPTGAETSAAPAFDANDAVDRLARSNAADHADLAHDLAQKKAKFAEQAHRPRHGSDTHADTPGGDFETYEKKRSPLMHALDKASDKFIEGGIMFACFSVIMGAMIALTPLSGIAGTIIAAAATGAIWLGSNEFIKQYRSASAHKDSRLNHTLDNVRDTFGQAKEKAHDISEHISRSSEKTIGELGVVGNAISSRLGSTGLMRHAHEAAQDASNQSSKAIQEILNNGPRRHAQSILERGSRADLSPEQLASEQAALDSNRSL